MYNVKQVIQAKGNSVWSVAPDVSALDALKLMADKDVGALVVLEEDRLVGIVSERDFVRDIAHLGSCDLVTPVRYYMTTTVITVAPNDTLENCMRIMTEKHIRHLPVLENQKLIGIISIGDVVKETIRNHEDTIHNLENYITGSYGQP